MKKQGISVMGIIVFVGLVAGISWGLNYMITKDYVVVRPSTVAANVINKDPELTPVATSTPTSTPADTTAVTTPATTTPPKTTTTPTAPTTPATSGLTVTYTDKGFSPSTLTVKKGQTVKFVNNSSDKLWVASNPFPTSSEYPAFNEKTGMAAGSSWSFTFDKTGTWFYHDHYTPALGGKIVVSAQ